MGDFANNLNKVADEANKKTKDVLTKDEFIANRINQYTDDIKELCTSSAKRGQHTLKGFFVPKRIDYNYETSIDGPFIINKSKDTINKKPSKNSMYGGLMGGNLDIVRDGNIGLMDGWTYKKPITFVTDDTMREKVRQGVIKNLSREGFKKLSIEPLKGPIYELKKVLLSEIIVQSGTANYFYVDIEW